MEEFKKIEEIENNKFESAFALVLYFLLTCKQGLWVGTCGDLATEVVKEYDADPQLRSILITSVGLGRLLVKYKFYLGSLFYCDVSKSYAGTNRYEFSGIRCADDAEKIKKVLRVRLGKDSVRYSARDIAGMCDAGVARYVWGEPDLYSEILAAKMSELKDWLEKYIGDMRKEMDREIKQAKAENKQLKKACFNAIKQVYKAMMTDSDCDNPLPHAP